MKKYITIAVVILGLASCTKENVPTDNNEQSLVFTASIEQPVNDDQSKTIISSTTGKVYWQINDEITIKDASNNEAIYYVNYIDNNGVATFLKKAGADLAINSTYKATYKDSLDIRQQWYKERCNGANCPMVANTSVVKPGFSSVNHFVFHNVYGVVNISATASDICAIKVGDYTLNFWSPVDMEAGKNYYMIAVPGGKEFQKVTFVKEDGRAIVSNFTTSKISVQKNHVLDVKLTNAKYADDAQYTSFEPLCLPGLFTIDGGKIRFSRGSLWSKAGKFYLETEQYNFRTVAGSQAGVSTLAATTGTGETGLFAYSDIYPSGSSAFPGWRAMDMSTTAKNEWKYLNTSDNRKTNLNMNQKTNIKYAGVMIGNSFDYETSGIKGILLFPDNFFCPKGVDLPALGVIGVINTGGNWFTDTYRYHRYSPADFDALEKAGCVFIPCAGYSENTAASKDVFTLKKSNFGTTNPDFDATFMGMTNIDRKFFTMYARGVNNWDPITPASSNIDYKVTVRLVQDVVYE